MPSATDPAREPIGRPRTPRRATAHRDTVARALAAHGGFVSAQDLFVWMRDRDRDGDRDRDRDRERGADRDRDGEHERGADRDRDRERDADRGDRIRNRPVSLSTTYRSLAALAADGSADSRYTVDGERQYRRRRRPDHHHLLICRLCGIAVEVHSEAVERWTASAGARHGFTEIRHAIELTGRCRRCR
ncbi:Fur family transcriptional regulator [Embleya sp. NPDC050493]|uniref:Fur family transcriptional regulator n=1 Tax=Embleya sp. NPDC050493 TaxID=3363989 RepID=UPI0037B874CC